MNAASEFPNDLDCVITNITESEVVIEGPINRLGAAERIFKELVEVEINKIVNE